LSGRFITNGNNLGDKKPYKLGCSGYSLKWLDFEKQNDVLDLRGSALPCCEQCKQMGAEWKSQIN